MNELDESEREKRRKVLKAKLKDKISNYRNSGKSAAASKQRPDLCATLLEHGVDDANILQVAKNLNVNKLRHVVEDMKRGIKAEASNANDEEALPPPESNHRE